LLAPVAARESPRRGWQGWLCRPRLCGLIATRPSTRLSGRALPRVAVHLWAAPSPRQAARAPRSARGRPWQALPKSLRASAGEKPAPPRLTRLCNTAVTCNSSRGARPARLHPSSQPVGTRPRTVAAGLGHLGPLPAASPAPGAVGTVRAEGLEGPVKGYRGATAA
jgi:hypothetical protein